MSDNIKYDELMTEIEGLIKESVRGPTRLTKEQYLCLRAARGSDFPVHWKALVAWWKKKGWGMIRISTLKSRYYRYQEEQND